MATNLKNLSDYEDKLIPSAEDTLFGIIVSEWNSEITNVLLDGAVETLIKHGAKRDNITVRYVPGTFELTTGAHLMAEYTDVDAVIAIGCVIRGETPHFDYICMGVTNGLTRLATKYTIPFIFGVLTVDNIEQAKERAGGKHGNKGVEAAVTAIKMVALHNDLLEISDDFDEDYWDDEELDDDELDEDDDEPIR
jgi:6,7-dimethyl-8-ribityllumazine synthase